MASPPIDEDDGLLEECPCCQKPLDADRLGCDCGYLRCPECWSWDIEASAEYCPECIAAEWAGEVWTPINPWPLAPGAGSALGRFRAAAPSPGPRAEAWLGGRLGTPQANRLLSAMYALAPRPTTNDRQGEAWDAALIGEFVIWGAVEDSEVRWRRFDIGNGGDFPRALVTVEWDQLDLLAEARQERTAELDAAIAALSGMLFEPCDACGGPAFPDDARCIEGCLR